MVPPPAFSNVAQLFIVLILPSFLVSFLLSSLRGSHHWACYTNILPIFISCTFSTGWTPLTMASLYGHIDVVRILVESGAEVDLMALLH